MVGVAALVAKLFGKITMRIPAAMKQLHGAHAAFDEPARHQAALGEGAGLRHVRPVEIEGRLGLTAQVGELGHAALQTESHFILVDARPGIGVAVHSVAVLVEVPQRV